MQFKEGAEVFTTYGERVGTIDRVVLDPQTKEVTHLVVNKGFLFMDAKVVPMSLVGAATGDQVILRSGASGLDELPDFREPHVVPIDRGYGKPKYVVKTQENIPEDSVALEEGTKVLSSDGEHVGDIERFLTDNLEEQVTHLLISEGLILKGKKLIPTKWITYISEAEVRLSVDSNLVESLPKYQAQD